MMNCKICTSWKNYINLCVYYHAGGKFPECTLYNNLSCVCGENLADNKEKQQEYYDKIVWKYCKRIHNRTGKKVTKPELQKEILNNE